MLSPDSSTRELAALLEVSTHSPNPTAFRRAALEVLRSAIGFECAFFGAEAELTLDGYSAGQAATLDRNSATYQAELRPVERAALDHGGVAVDTAVFGARIGCHRYYRELVHPAGGGHSLLCYLELRGVPLGTVMLGRARTPFGSAELTRMRLLRPALALGVAGFGSMASATKGKPASRGLTPREQQIASYLCLGYTNREIALACGTSPNTVRNQLAGLFGKLGATTRSELVGLLMRQ